jgi:hypothetical protein
VVIDISTAVEPHEVAKGALLRIIDLDAVPWALHGYTGVAFKAAQILPGAAPVQQPTEPPGATSRREN